MDTNARISVSGKVVILQRPCTLLMQVHLVESADSIDNALGVLKQRTDSARRLLQQLEATDIEFGEPLLGDLDNDASHVQARIAKQTAEILARTQSFGRPAPRSPQRDADAKVRIRVRARWPLPASGDETLLFVARLRRGLADIGGVSLAEKESLPVWPTPAEEIQAAMSRIGNQQQDHRIPRFFYISKLSDEQQLQACTEAFALARNRAEQMAQATGGQLGKLAHLSESSMIDPLTHQALIRRQFSNEEWPQSDPDALEIIWDDQRAVRFTVGVSAGFELLPASPSP